MNIILSSWAHGLGTCWIAGDKKQYAEGVRELLNVPERYGLISLIPAGYPAEKPAPPGKKPLGQASFRNAL
jgi:nitroreductase